MHILVLKIIAIAIFCASCWAADSEESSLVHYSVTIDIARCSNDQVQVTVIPPQTLTCDECRYVIPRSVPGTYSLDRYGRFIVEARAFDRHNNPLPVERDSDGDIIVKGKPARLEYLVEDTWDHPVYTDVFNPTGSNIQCDTNVVLNFHAFVGYFEGTQRSPYLVTITKPSKFYGATSLRRLRSTDTADYFVARTYMELVDNPAMYCIPDTVSLDQGGVHVMIAIYSSNRVMTAQKIAEYLKPVLSSVSKFLGSMPVDHYTFLFYFAGRQQLGQMVRSLGFGALEHSYSSMYFLAEGRGAETTARELIQSTAAHEFLHILVPLHLHSEEIENFDFRSPHMSQHLWLYEGCTEYFQLLARAQDTLMEEDEFVRTIVSNLRATQLFYRSSPVALTELSQRVLEDRYQKLFPVVYLHGPAVAFCLDVTIRQLTNGRMDLLSAIGTLMTKYGPDKPFRDDELFDEFAAIVHPSLREFFRRYVEGTEFPPIGPCMQALGYRYQDSAEIETFDFPSTFTLSRTVDAPVIVVRQQTNDFGFVNGDTLIRINDIPVTPENKYELVSRYIWAPQSGDTVRVLVRRGKEQVELRAAPRRSSRRIRYVISADPAAGAEALAFRRQFFRKDQ